MALPLSNPMLRKLQSFLAMALAYVALGFAFYWFFIVTQF